MKNENRIVYIDFFRGIGILLMVMGHMSFGGLYGFGPEFDKFIHAFHMPMFFVISGYFFHMKDNYKVFFNQKLKTLILPYVFFGFCYSSLWILSNKATNFKPVLRLLWNNDSDLPYEGALWFLTAIFFSYVIYDLIHRLVYRKEYILFITVICVAIGHLTCFYNIDLPWSLDAALIGVGLMYFGELIHRKKLLYLKWYWLIALIVVVGLGIYLNKPVNMNSGIYGNVLLFWINAIGATVVGLNLSRLLCCKFSKSIIINYFSWIGNNSIVFLCCNHLPILFVSRLLLRFGLSNTVLATIISMMLISFICLVFINTPLILFIGKYKKKNNRT